MARPVSGPLRVFTLLHDARPVLLNLGEPGGLDFTPWADRARLTEARYAGPGTFQSSASFPLRAPCCSGLMATSPAWATSMALLTLLPSGSDRLLANLRQIPCHSCPYSSQVEPRHSRCGSHAVAQRPPASSHRVSQALSRGSGKTIAHASNSSAASSISYGASLRACPDIKSLQTAS